VARCGCETPVAPAPLGRFHHGARPCRYGNERPMPPSTAQARLSQTAAGAREPSRDHADLTDFVDLARRLSIPADDAIRQFIDRLIRGTADQARAPITT
jgi:hypothetical protein